MAVDAKRNLGFIAGGVTNGPQTRYGGAVEVANLTTGVVLRTAALAFGPTAIAFDPRNGELFITGASDVVALNVTSLKQVQDLVVGGNPIGVVYDSGSGDLYVAGGSSNEVVVVNGANDTVLATIPVGRYPNVIAYDPSNGYIYAASSSSGNISVILPTTNRVIATIAAGIAYGQAAYDSWNGNLYLSQANGPIISVLSGTSLAWNFSNPLNPGAPTGDIDGIAFDAENGDLYIVEAYSCNIGIINSTTNGSLGAILPNQCPTNYLLTYDPGNGNLYASVAYAINGGSYSPLTEYVISGRTNAVVGTFVFATQLWTGMAYDPVTQETFVTDHGSNSVFVWNGSARRVVAYFPGGWGPAGIAYDPANGNLYIADMSDNAPSSAGHYLQVVNATNFGGVAQISIGGYAGGYSGVAYDPANGYLYFSGSQGGLIFVVNGATNQWIKTLSITGSGGCLFDCSGIVYDPRNGYLYMTDAYSGVAVLNPANDSVVAYIPAVGTAAITYDPSTNDIYVPGWWSGGVYAISGATNTIVGNLTTSGGTGGIAYDPDNRAVYVTGGNNGNVSGINVSTGRSFVNLALCSSTQGILYDPSTGELVADCSGSGALSVLDSGVRYPVTFTALGLPAAATWAVDVGGASTSVTGSTAVVNEPFGSYSFSVRPPVGYLVLPSSGQVQVTPRGTVVPLRFILVNPPSSSVSFNESGLPTGTNWAVQLVRTDSLALGVNTLPGTSLDNGAAYDSANGLLYVSETTVGTTIGPDGFYRQYGNVTAFNGTTGVAVASVPLGVYSRAIAYDAANGNIYVVNSSSARYWSGVTVINGASNRAIAFVRLGGLPLDIAYDSAHNRLFVSYFDSDTVSVIDGSTNSLVGSFHSGVTVGYIVFDPTNGYVYDAGTRCTPSNPCGYSVQVISSANDSVTQSLTLRSPPGGLVYDGLNGHLYESDLAGRANIIDPSTLSTVGSAPVGLEPQGLAVDTADGNIYVTNIRSDTVTILDGTTGGVVGTVAVGISPRAACFDPAAGSMFVLNAGGTNLTRITPYYGGTSGPSIQFAVPNGAYLYFASSAGGFVATPSAGTLVVNSSSLTESILFRPYAPPTYALAFSESGLPTGTNWSVTVAASSGGSIVSTTSSPVTRWSNGGSTVVFQVSNGTFNYTVAAPGLPPEHGTVQVVGSAPAPIQYVVAPATGSGGPAPAPSVGLWYWYVLGAVATAGALGWVVVLTRRRRPPREGAQ